MSEIEEETGRGEATIQFRMELLDAQRSSSHGEDETTHRGQYTNTVASVSALSDVLRHFTALISNVSPSGATLLTLQPPGSVTITAGQRAPSLHWGRQYKLIPMLLNFCHLFANTQKRYKLDGQGTARREAARRCKSECKINLGPR